jgi:hypothetical protein
MLAANPATTPRLSLDEEAREITERLRLSHDRDSFELLTCWAVRPGDLLQQLNQHRPHIVHISGHGNASGEIILASAGGEQRVSTEALGALFQTMKDNIRIVVLNACHSTVQAQTISRHIDHVIGMRAPIGDQAAIVFAAAFYSALGFHRTVQEAFDQATTALLLHGLAAHNIVELITRPGADPHTDITPAAGNGDDRGPTAPEKGTTSGGSTTEVRLANWVGEVSASGGGQAVGINYGIVHQDRTP